MNWRKYVKDGRLILPEGFNSDLNCFGNKLSKLILPEGFNSNLYCNNNNLTELILPEGFNKNLKCNGNNSMEIVLPKGFDNKLLCDNDDLYIINWVMNKRNIDYFEAGYRIWKELDMDKLPKLKAYIRNKRIEEILI